jgi:hypothetical protein
MTFSNYFLYVLFYFSLAFFTLRLSCFNRPNDTHEVCNVMQFVTSVSDSHILLSSQSSSIINLTESSGSVVRIPATCSRGLCTYLQPFRLI